MASNMGARESREEYYKLQLRQGLARGLRAKSKQEFSGPFMGYCPDLPTDQLDPGAWQNCQGLVIKPGPSKVGTVIMNDAGFEKLDSARLPLAPGGHSNAHANGAGDITAIAQFNLRNASGVAVTTLSTSLVAWTAGNGSTAGSGQMWTIAASETEWREIPHAGTATGSEAMAGNIDGNPTALEQSSMMDWTEFPLGAPGRGNNANHDSINTPALVFTNNSDNVMVFPAEDSNLTDYEELNVDRFGGTFKCISVETYNDRVYFLNTMENTSRQENKIRRSARGTCDFLETTAGAGSIVVEQLSTGLKLLTLGDILVAYFNDGVAFIRDTFNPSAPNSVQIISPRSAKRGLLGTHAAVEIPGRGHFCIMNDGWWLLDPNGRFTELGIARSQIEQSHKWRTTFYTILDDENSHRIQTIYDSKRNWVRIIVPKSGEQAELWIYDVENDRVFRDEYAVVPTCYGKSVVQLNTATRWSDMVDGSDTWDAIVGNWESFGANQGQEFLLHGDVSGNVFIHKENLITKDGASPNWSLETVDHSFGNNNLKRIDKVNVKHITSNNPSSMTVTLTMGNQNSTSRSKQLDSTSSNPGDEERHETWFTTATGETASISLSGEGPVQIRSYGISIVDRNIERT